MGKFRNVLVATDFSEVSDYALERAVELASQIGGQVTVVHVCEPPSFGFPDPAFIEAKDIMRQLREGAEKALAATVARFAGAPIPVAGTIRVGAPIDELEVIAKEVGADLLVVGTHGRKGITRALLGSVAEKLIRLSKLPVLVVHPPDAA